MSHNDNNLTPIRKKNAFLDCIKTYYKISLFTGSPDQLSSNVLCIYKAVGIYCLINIWLLDTHSSLIDVLIKILVEIGLLVIFLKIGLKVTNKSERFVQTLSALVGSGMIVSLVSVPIYYLFIPQFLEQQEISQSVINITLLLLIWNLAVISHIFKRSLDISTLMSAVIAFNYLIVFQILIISMVAETA